MILEHKGVCPCEVFCNHGVDKSRKSFSRNGQESLGNERRVKEKKKRCFRKGDTGAQRNVSVGKVFS